MKLRSIAAAALIGLSALSLIAPAADARPRDGRDGGGRVYAAPQGYAPRPVAAPRGFAGQVAQPRVFARQQIGGPRVYNKSVQPRAYAPAGPRYAAPRYAAPQRFAGQSRGYPRFLGHPLRRFWHGRWLWLGAPIVGYAYDQCWQRVWTDWGWGWYYTCGYDSGYVSAPQLFPDGY